MRDLVVLLIHFIASLARLLGPGGARSLVAESLLLKHQLLILNRSRQRAPNLSASDRILAGWLALWLRPTRLLRSAIVLKPSTLIGLHQAMCKQSTACCSHLITIANPARRDRVQNSSTWSSK
jgi:putative transposase